MLEIGTTVTNARTRTLMTLEHMDETTFRVRYSSPEAPNRFELPGHVHENWDEEFAVLEGRARHKLDRDWCGIGEGDTVTLPRGKPHIHPFGVGDGPSVIVQSGTVVNGRPDAIRETLGVLFSLIDRQARGTIALARSGYPTNPLIFAALGKVLGDNGSFDARFPIPFQKFGAATLGRLAVAMGTDVIDEKYL